MLSVASVCVFVSLSVRQVTSERLNEDDEASRLGAMYKNVAQVRMSKSKVKRQGHRKQKNENVRHVVRESSSGTRSSCGIFFGRA